MKFKTFSVMVLCLLTLTVSLSQTAEAKTAFTYGQLGFDDANWSNPDGSLFKMESASDLFAITISGVTGEKYFRIATQDGSNWRYYAAANDSQDVELQLNEETQAWYKGGAGEGKAFKFNFEESKQYTMRITPDGDNVKITLSEKSAEEPTLTNVYLLGINNNWTDCDTSIPMINAQNNIFTYVFQTEQAGDKYFRTYAVYSDGTAKYFKPQNDTDTECSTAVEYKQVGTQGNGAFKFTAEADAKYTITLNAEQQTFVAQKIETERTISNIWVYGGLTDPANWTDEQENPTLEMTNTDGTYSYIYCPATSGDKAFRFAIKYSDNTKEFVYPQGKTTADATPTEQGIGYEIDPLRIQTNAKAFINEFTAGLKYRIQLDSNEEKISVSATDYATENIDCNVEVYQLIETAENNYIAYNPDSTTVYQLTVDTDNKITENVVSDFNVNNLAADNYRWTEKLYLRNSKPEALNSDFLDTKIIGYKFKIDNNEQSELVAANDNGALSYICNATFDGTQHQYNAACQFSYSLNGEQPATTPFGQATTHTATLPQARKADNAAQCTINTATETNSANIKYGDKTLSKTDFVYYTLNHLIPFAQANVSASLLEKYNVEYLGTLTITNANNETSTQQLDASSAKQDVENNALCFEIQGLNPADKKYELTITTKYTQKENTENSYTPSNQGIIETVENKYTQAQHDIKTGRLFFNGPSDNGSLIYHDGGMEITSDIDNINGTEVKNLYAVYGAGNTEVETIYDYENTPIDNEGRSTGIILLTEKSLDEIKQSELQGTPIHIFKIGDEYVTLVNTTVKKDISTMVGIDNCNADNITVVAGNGFIEISGSDAAIIYDMQGSIVGYGAKRHNLVAGIYLVKTENRIIKVSVR